METNKNNGATNGTANTPAANPANGFDLNGLLGGNGGEVIKYLLTTGGAVLINYLLSIKPMQDKMEAMSKKIEDHEGEIKKQRGRIEELEDGQEQLIEQLNHKERERTEQEELQGGNGEYFSIRKNKARPSHKRRRYED